MTKRIRADYSEMIIIVLTSYDLPEYREAAYRSGANYFFTKGQTPSEEITALLASILPRGAEEEKGIGISGSSY